MTSISYINKKAGATQMKLSVVYHYKISGTERIGHKGLAIAH